MDQSLKNNSTPLSPRQCAAEVLHAVLGEKRPLDEALARHKPLAGLSERDRGFVRLMIMTVLRRLGQIDALLSGLLEKPLTGKTQDVMHCLRLGVAQLIWLETPPHAAVHAMVDTVEAMGHERMKGLVNAVLKRVAKEGAAIVAAQDEAVLNLPSWIYESWQEAYGNTVAREIATARLAEPPLDITVKSDAPLWAEKLGGTVLPTGSVRVTQAGRIENLMGFAEGQWWIQDAAAALPVALLGDVRGLRVLDLCAAPGGKTAQLLAAGAFVTSVDKSTRRLALLSDNLRRLDFIAETIEADIMKFKPEGEFDAVLLDAPCTATGTLRRHPEVVWHKTPEDVTDLAAVQRRLLARVAQWIVPGGRLLYCVCSLQPEEGELQAQAFGTRFPDFVAMPVPQALKALAMEDAQEGIRTHPGLLHQAGGMDGFYAICWQRLKNI
jgi:16S rRNA (cytosine967-C5)-methyltransferase